MANGKWIDGLQAEQAPHESARLALIERLAVVRAYLPGAVHHTEDPENVHQLRVGTRRADAVLKIFRTCLPLKDFKKARHRLRSLRRAAGAARDWDVFALGLAERRRDCPAKEHPGLDYLLGHALGCRAVAQNELHALGLEECQQFAVFVTDTIAAVCPARERPLRRTLIALARPTLAGLRDDLVCAASADLTDDEMLHQVRIAGKRLRYAMEIFAGCFEPPFKEQLYPQIEEMQDILGRANDSRVAGARLRDIRLHLRTAWRAEWVRLRPGVEGTLRVHERRLPQERKRFLAWWKQWQDQGAVLFDTCLG